MKKRKLKSVCFCIFIVILIILILVMYKVFFSEKSKIVGTWTTDNVTIYKFNKNNTGKLIVSLSEYEFKYTLKNDVLYIDFINDKSEDSEYNYSFKNNKLVLKNEKGTFTFTKK